jgi:hypothetical protein
VPGLPGDLVVHAHQPPGDSGNGSFFSALG